jgi:nucleoid-associated protein YgaU
LENIAYQYYNDGSLWWIIAKANGLTDAVIENADKKIRIPTQIESILKKVEIESY